MLRLRSPSVSSRIALPSMLGTPQSSLSLHLKSPRVLPHIVFQRPRILQELHVRPIRPDTTLLALLDVLLAAQRREPPVLGDDDLLPPGELVLRAAEGLDGGRAVAVARADRQDDLADVDARDGAVGLAEGAAHAGLQPIGAGAGQHLVDADDVEGVGADAHVETFLAGDLDEVSWECQFLEG